MDRWDDEWERYYEEQHKADRGKPGRKPGNAPPPRVVPNDPEELDGVLTWPPGKRRR